MLSKELAKKGEDGKATLLKIFEASQAVGALGAAAGAPGARRAVAPRRSAAVEPGAATAACLASLDRAAVTT